MSDNVTKLLYFVEYKNRKILPDLSVSRIKVSVEMMDGPLLFITDRIVFIIVNSEFSGFINVDFIIFTNTMYYDQKSPGYFLITFNFVIPFRITLYFLIYGTGQ